MFKKILVPISEVGLKKNVLKKISSLASADQSSVCFLYISPKYPPIIYSEVAVSNLFTIEEHKKHCESFASTMFDKTRKLFDNSITADFRHAFSDDISGEIISEAKRLKCDLIVMTSHKYKGIKSIFIGSTTQSVIVNTKLPVLVL
jgi:nucleotide-binding universal stress UspA family protein